MQSLRLQDIKSVYRKGLIEPDKHLSWNFLQKTLTAYNRKQFSQKVPPYMFERVLIIPTLILTNPTPPNY